MFATSQCSKINSLKNEITRQENNQQALTEQLVNYEDELGRANAEKHAYQLTQKELRDSIGLLKKKNTEYISYIKANMGIKDTVKIETVIFRDTSLTIDGGCIAFEKADTFGNSYRNVNVSIPYNVDDNKLYTGNATFVLNQNIFVEGWLERNTKTKETYIHLRSDYPGVVFNSGMGVVAEPSKQYEKDMRKSCGIGLAVGPCINLGYDFVNKNFAPTVGIGLIIGFTYTPKSFQW